MNNEVTERYAQLTCPHHGKVGLTPHQYHEQLMESTTAWHCPHCHTIALFDYDYWNKAWEEDGREA